MGWQGISSIKGVGVRRRYWIGMGSGTVGVLFFIALGMCCRVNFVTEERSCHVLAEVRG